MSELERFNRVVEAVYDAAMDDARWHDLATQFAQLFDVHSCALQLRDTHGGMTLLGVTGNVTADRLVREYQQHYYKIDLWALAAMELPHRRQTDIAMTEEQIGVSRQTILRSEIYDFHHQTDMWYLIGANIDLGGGTNGIIGIHGGHNAKPFDNIATDKLNLLLPHLRRAFQMRAALRRHAIGRDMAMGALDALDSAVIVVDENAKLLYANAAGNALLRSDSALGVLGGRIHAVVPEQDQVLAHRIRQACLPALDLRNTPPCGTVALPRTGQPPLFATVARISAGDMSAIRDMPLAMLLIPTSGENGEKRVPSPDVLRTVFRLSQAEAELACRLAEGHDVKEIASHRGISLNTARTQLKAALQKTQTRRQSELVALVLGLR